MLTLHVDMDGVLCNYAKLHKAESGYGNPFPQSREGFFEELEPMPDALYAMKKLRERYRVYILTSPSYMNPHCYRDKRRWVNKYFGLEFCKNLIICMDKSLVKGDFLIDDNIDSNNQSNFEGQLIHFGSEKYPDWKAVLNKFR